MNFITIFYNVIIIPMLQLIMLFASLFNKKLREREGRWEDIFEYFIEKDIFRTKKTDIKRIWFHAASMGEFEQAKPLIEKIKAKYPQYQIIVSFYSPSGYNNQKNYEFADAVLYMPFDKRSNAFYFIQTIKPDIAIFIRYEIWRNHLYVLNKLNIPIYLICATKPNQKFLYDNSIIKSFTKSNYNYFTSIYTTSEEQTKFFRDLGVSTKIITSADTRFDRIIEKVENSKKNEILPKSLFSENEFKLVAGSTWEPDEEIIINSVNTINKEENYFLRLVLVPHEPTAKRVSILKKQIPNSLLLSQVLSFIKKESKSKNISQFLGLNHIIVDSIGQLLTLYSIADFAYIGGAWGAGIHSVTEPAGYGIPLFSGPKLINSPDAVNLLKSGALNIVNDSVELISWINELIDNEKERKRLGEILKKYVYKAKGSSDIILNDILVK